jgi:hypothetical protein
MGRATRLLKSSLPGVKGKHALGRQHWRDFESEGGMRKIASPLIRSGHDTRSSGTRDGFGLIWNQPFGGREGGPTAYRANIAALRSAAALARGEAA